MNGTNAIEDNDARFKFQHDLFEHNLHWNKNIFFTSLNVSMPLGSNSIQAHNLFFFYVCGLYKAQDCSNVQGVWSCG